MSYYRNDDHYTETDTYRRDGYDGRVTDTTTTTYSDNSYGGPPAPPPNVPRPWYAEWMDRERRYIFVNERTQERQWDFPREDVYSSSTTTTYYDDDDGARNYGGRERVYDQNSSTTTTTVTDEQQRGFGGSGGGGGHGMLYGAMGAAAGLAGGAFLMHEGEKIHDDYDYDKYRVEQDVDDFPDNAAAWTGRKVGEVEDIPQDVEQGFDRFGNRIELGFDNAVDDVVDAPENVAGWVGRKVGDVERFDDGVDNAYDEGKYEGRNDGW